VSLEDGARTVRQSVSAWQVSGSLSVSLEDGARIVSQSVSAWQVKCESIC
jgi:hypothetical protein